MNAIQLLKDDHQKILGLLADLTATATATADADKKRSDLLASFAHEWETHTSLEEEIFYPAFGDAGLDSEDARLHTEALEAHRAADAFLLPDLLRTSPASEHFRGRAKVLKDLIEHHLGEEERSILPRAEKILAAAQLQRLGERMAARRLELDRLGKFGKLGKLAKDGSVLMDTLANIVTPESAMRLDDSGTVESTRKLPPAARSSPPDPAPRAPRR
jgi:hemerythrin-like domain-containing protein